MVRCASRRCVLHFLLLRYKKQGASYVFCLSEYIGREETEKESLVTFFVYPYSPLHSLQPPNICLWNRVWPNSCFLSGCGFMFSLPTHNPIAQEASQGSRELDYSVIQLYFHWSCIESRIEGALDKSKTGAVLTAPLIDLRRFYELHSEVWRT